MTDGAPADDPGGDRIRITPTCVISANELDWRFTRSGGPGGQHANTSDTRVEVRFDVAGSPSLTESQRQLLLERIGAEARAGAQDERSQSRNRDVALDRLRQQLADGLHRPARRRKTKPSKGAKKRRLEAKRQHSQKKARRRWSPGDG